MTVQYWLAAYCHHRIPHSLKAYRHIYSKDPCIYGYGEQYNYEDQRIPVYPGRNRSQASSAAVVPQMEEDSSRRNAIGDPIATSTPVENRRTPKEPCSKPDYMYYQCN
ncbi:uncharacterized protein LOC111101855 [Crassostrea virginica]